MSLENLVVLIPPLCWGIQPLLVAKVGGLPKQQVLGSTLGALALALVALNVVSPHLSRTVVLAGFASGACCAVGQTNQFRSFALLGVSTAMPAIVCLQLLGTSLIGVLVFHEWPTGAKVALGTTGLVVVMLGVAMTSYKEHHDIKSRSERRAGLLALLLCGAGLVAYVIIPKWFGVNGWDAILPQSVGLLTTAFLLSLRGEGRPFVKKTWLNILPGLIWATGNLALLLADERVGVTTGFTVSQMGVIISTLGGVFLLGEHKTRKELVLVFIGVALVIAGGILVGQARA
ncbi:hypothetical protein MFUL124B02_36020 [Myxococcus fulvus 124B02]|nr:hypothetical protein MFUL124B02_36020 [Myxococcus fulvus 124B02]